MDSDAAAHATHAEVKRSTQAIERSTADQTDSADRRTELAADRTILAAERTYAAWVRTGLSALAAGVGARALLAKLVPAWMTVSTGGLLILFSAFCFIAAVWRETAPSVQPPRPRARRIPVPLLIAVNGFLVLVSLSALAGVLMIG